MARRLVDHGRYSDLDQLALAATNNICLLLAINLELRAVRRSPPKKTIEIALRLILNKGVNIKTSNFLDDQVELEAITALVESAHVYQLRCRGSLASLLKRYLPEIPPKGLNARYSIGQRFPLLRAYALRAELEEEDLQLIDLAYRDLREQLENDDSTRDTHGLREFKGRIGALLPWHKLWAENFLNRKAPSALVAEIDRAHQESAKAENALYSEESHISDEIAEVWFEILIDGNSVNEALLQEFRNWIGHLKRPLYIPTWIRLARLSARTQNFESYAYRFTQRAFDLMRDAKEDAESKAQTYVDLARAILIKDKSEAKEYFNQAIEVASKIGDEILDRWSAILDLADRAADPSRPCPRTAYELARRSELIYHYVYRDKHFEWERTVAAIAGLCPSSCFAILSRWRDRDFGEPKRLIAAAIDYLIAHRCIDSKTVPAFVAFRAHWEYSDLLEKTFEVSASHSEREKVLSHVLHYMRLDEQSASEWKTLKVIAKANALTISDIDRLIEHADRREAALDDTNRSYDDGRRQVGQNSEKDLDRIFLNLDLHTPNGLSNAYSNFKSSEPPFYREAFFSELFKRIPIGKEAKLIRVFFEAAEFDLYDARHFLEQLPEEWKSRMAVRSSLREAIRRLCGRHCLEINKNRYYEPFPFATSFRTIRCFGTRPDWCCRGCYWKKN